MKLIHISDLHFGTELPGIGDEIRNAINRIGPDKIIVSGDFTQIASTEEFHNARHFLDSLQAPVFCVPGNHDIPRFDMVERLLDPYKKYKKFISDDLFPVFDNGDIIIAGLNSARRALPHWNWANGAISEVQLTHLKKIYDNSSARRRICVFHHPVHKALNAPLRTVVFGANEVLRAMNELRVDLVLTGHVHHASITTIGDMDHNTLYLSASTALSSRLRQQENGFNVIHIDEKALVIQIFIYNNGVFSESKKYTQVFPA